MIRSGALLSFIPGKGSDRRQLFPRIGFAEEIGPRGTRSELAVWLAVKHVSFLLCPKMKSE